MIGGLSSITPTHQRGTKGLMWGARGSFLPAAAMVVMVAVGSWSLGHSSTVGIVYVFYGINLFFGINIYASIKSIRPVRPGPMKFIQFVYITFILSLLQHEFGINILYKFWQSPIRIFCTVDISKWFLCSQSLFQKCNKNDNRSDEVTMEISKM